MDKTRDQIQSFVQELLSEQGYHEKVMDDQSLILSGLLDSIAVVHMVVFLENTFDINFAGEYFDQNMFDTVNRVVELVSELRS